MQEFFARNSYRTTCLNVMYMVHMIQHWMNMMVHSMDMDIEYLMGLLCGKKMDPVPAAHSAHNNYSDLNLWVDSFFRKAQPNRV